LSSVNRLADAFRAARRDERLAVLEGFHALKHALRFGAEPIVAVGTDPGELERLATELAPDLSGRFAAFVERVDAATFAQLAPHPPRTRVVAIARRPPVDLSFLLHRRSSNPVVLLENPRDLANVGACVRVAAAAGAAGLVTTGTSDPWHPDAVRGAAGLQYALPVARIGTLPESRRPLIAVDPDGDEELELPPGAILAFGSERRGLSDELVQRADARLAIPMRPGVSSLNLATAVAAVLYSSRMARRSAS
jgi:TrmH family RNA methyltransferase